MGWRWGGVTFTTLLALLVAVVIGAPAAGAASSTIAVTTTSDTLDPDDGLVSLREAVLLADVAGHTDTIVLAPGATYDLTFCGPVGGFSVNGTLFVRAGEQVTIDGQGATIRPRCEQGTPDQHSDAITTSAPNLTLRDLTITGADSGVAMAGGTPALTLERVHIRDASGPCIDRGPVNANRAVTMRFSTLDGCGGFGITGSGAAGALDLRDSEITRVTRVGSADAMALVGRDASLLRTTIHHNEAGVSLEGTVTVLSSHFDHNYGPRATFGVAQYEMKPPGFTAVDSTFDDNTTTAAPGNGLVVSGLNIGAFAQLTRVSVSRNHGPRAGLGFAGGSTLGNAPSATVVDSHIDANVTDVPTAGRRAAGIAFFGNQGSLSLTGTTANGNVGHDTAGLWSQVSASIKRSTFAGNTVPDSGVKPIGADLAGVVVSTAGMALVESTVSGNSVRASTGPDPSGAVVSFGGTVAHSTIANNAADVGGVVGYGSVRNATLSDNVGSKARHLWAADNLYVGATVVTSPEGAAGPSCAGLTGAVRSAGYNFLSDTTCPLTMNDPKNPPDVVGGGDPQLGVLGAAGGPTATRSPLASSPLRDRIPPVIKSQYLCQDPDQRGVPVPQGTGCDIGAVEATGSRFHALAPTRLADSRLSATPGFDGKLQAGAPRSLKVTGGAVPESAAAVVVNVTATGSSANSFLTLWPDGNPEPTASALNFATGQTIPNLVTVQVGVGGKVRFATNTGGTDVVVDLLGYYDDGTGAGDGWTGIDPVRALDSRTATGGWNGRLVAGTPRDLTVRPSSGGSGLPPSATAVVANVTASGSTANSFVTVWPAGADAPSASNINVAAGETIANAVIVPIGQDGAIRFATAVGATDVVVDIVGYFDREVGARFFPLPPTRVLDDRVGLGAVGPWGPNQTRDVLVAGGAIRADAVGIAANVTVTNGTAPSFISIFPYRTDKPDASTLNFGSGQTIANQSMVRVVTGKISIVNLQGSVDVIADVVGYYDTHFEGSLP